MLTALEILQKCLPYVALTVHPQDERAVVDLGNTNNLAEHHYWDVIDLQSDIHLLLFLWCDEKLDGHAVLVGVLKKIYDFSPISHGCDNMFHGVFVHDKLTHWFVIEKNYAIRQS